MFLKKDFQRKNNRSFVFFPSKFVKYPCKKLSELGCRHFNIRFNGLSLESLVIETY